VKFVIPTFVLFLGIVANSTFSSAKPEYTKKERLHVLSRERQVERVERRWQVLQRARPLPRRLEASEVNGLLRSPRCLAKGDIPQWALLKSPNLLA